MFLDSIYHSLIRLAGKSNRNKIPSTTTVVLLIYLLTSCQQVEMQDSSDDPKFSDLIGERFRIKEDVWITGITNDQNYKKKLDLILLSPGVGFTGPEVLWREHFGKNQVILIRRVLTAKSAFLSRVRYIVQFERTNKYSGYEIVVRVVGSVSDSNLGLNSKIFEHI